MDYRGRGNISCHWVLSITSSAQRGSVSFAESSPKVQSWSTHSSLHSRDCGLLQLACCVWGLTVLQMHPTVSQTKELSHQTSLWGTGDDLARCVTHHTPCWQASHFQLHGCTSDRCSMCVSVTRPCCSCLSTQQNFVIHIQDEFPAQSREGVLLTLHCGWLLM